MSAARGQTAGARLVYSRASLFFYDLGVVGFSHRFVWQSPARRIEAHYDQHITANHLEVGAGTGYFLDCCHFPSSRPRIALMDLNPGPLAFASKRIERYRPETYRRDILEPISIDAKNFDSVGINDVLHCVPGTIESKAVAFDHLKRLMNPNAVLFGSTLLQDGVPRSRLAQRLMDVYNRRGLFSNESDSLDGLKRALEQRFRDVTLEVVGCSALFSGRA